MNHLDPQAKAPLPITRGGSETNKQVQFHDLSHEALRDIARNESTDRAWRKAAVEHLLDLGSQYAHHPDLAFLLAEVRDDRRAKDEVKAAVESATEQALPSEVESLKEHILILEAELEAYRNPARPR